MHNFIEILSFFGYDMDKAQEYIDNVYGYDISMIEEILQEAGLETCIPTIHIVK